MAQQCKRISDREQMVLDLLSLRQQLAAIAGTPAVTGAWRLAADVMPVLEPVWGIVGMTSAEVEAVGFLRRYGQFGVPPGAGLNAAVTERAAVAFGALDLTAPSRRDVWSALACPAHALINSVDISVGDIGQPGTLRARFGPQLPAGLLNEQLGDEEVVPALRRILRAWCEIARHATGDRRDVAELLLASAQLARGAALDGDTDTVRWFVECWLGLPPTETRVDGTVAALLADGWRRMSADRDLMAAQDAVADLRIRASGLRSAAKRQHRLHRPVWETELHGSPVSLLSDPLPGSGGPGMTTAEGIASVTDDPVAVVNQILLEEQVEHVLDTLSQREAEIVKRFAQGQSWTQISREMGLTRYKLDQLREKIFRKLRHPSRSQLLVDYRLS